jgi:ParB/RepB/Spo0J family partition protein
MELKGEVKRVNIEEVFPNTFNPKVSIEESKENAEKFESIKAGIVKWGMFEAIVVRRVNGHYEIIDGYHRWRGCKELGHKDILVNDLGDLITDDIAKKINILKEEARVPLDVILTSRMLKELSKESTNLEELAREIGYNQAKLKEDLEIADFDWNQFQDGGVEIEPPRIEENVVEIKATEEEIKAINEHIVKSMGSEGEDLNVVRLLKIDRIIMTKEQKKILFQAIEKIMKDNVDVKSKGRAIELICGDFLSGN